MAAANANAKGEKARKERKRKRRASVHKDTGPLCTAAAGRLGLQTGNRVSPGPEVS